MTSDSEEKGNPKQFVKLFGPAEVDYGIRPEALVVHAQQRGRSQAYVPVSSATLLDSIPPIVTSLMNPLLRSLGHGLVWREFEDNVRVIAQGE